MNILYVGDVMAETGLRVVEEVLPTLRTERQVDLVVAQAENVTEGRGITPTDFKRLLKSGVDFCSGGNHTFDQKSIYPQLSDPNQPIIRPANYPIGTPGLGWKYTETSAGKVLLVSLLGQIVGKHSNMIVDNPLQIIDGILAEQAEIQKAAIIVNFHGDFSSEKVIIGKYLAGRVTAVIGDHWHIPTADADILAGGTAHVTDVGMCGALDSSLGVTFDSVIPRWRDGIQTHNQLETGGRKQFNAVLITTDEYGMALSIEQIRRVF
jgi:metallophosphoesterase (TIGR00282 family)